MNDEGDWFVKIRVEDVVRNKVIYLKVKLSEVKVVKVVFLKYVILFERVVFFKKFKESFFGVIDIFFLKDCIRRGYMEFLKIVMVYMEEFGVEKDVEVYNRLLDVFLWGWYDNRIFFDVIWVKKYL